MAVIVGKDGPDSGDVHVDTPLGGKKRKATKLTNLLVKEVSVCDTPANQKSKITLYKNDDSMNLIASGGVVKMTLEELQKALEDALKKNEALEKSQKESTEALEKATAEIAELKKNSKPAEPTQEDLMKALPAEILKTIEAIQKDAKEAKEQLASEVEKRVTAELAKRAETELPNLAGDSDIKGQLLKAAEGIGDKAVAMLKSANEAMSKNFQELGNSAPVTKGDAESELDKRANELAKSKNITFAKAYSEVIQTADGGKLYKEYEDSKRKK